MTTPAFPGEKPPVVEQPNAAMPQPSKSGAVVFMVLAVIFNSTSLFNELSSGNKSTSQTHSSDRIDYYSINTKITVKRDFYACTNVEVLDRIIALIRAKDSVAAARYATEEDCETFGEGAEAIVEHESVWHTAMCLRSYGQTTCRWFPAMLVKGPDDHRI